SKVLPVCNYPRVIFGYDMMTEAWKTERLYYRDYVSENKSYFYKESVDMTPEEIHSFLTEYGYEYAVLGVDCITAMRHNATKVQQTIMAMEGSDLFSLVRNVETEFLFRVE
ncbi:MAG: hypothetical protein ACOC32_04425, partial [Nanoarchaeota archaeon]